MSLIIHYHKSMNLCVWGGGGRLYNQRLLVVTPGQSVVFSSGWLKLIARISGVTCQDAALMASLSTSQECSPAKALHTSQDERPFRAHGAKRVQATSVLFLATWNVRTLLDVDGPMETARQQGHEVPALLKEIATGKDISVLVKETSQYVNKKALFSVKVPKIVQK